MFTREGGGGGVHSNLAARGQNKSEKWCCQITVRSSRTICNKDCSISEIKKNFKNNKYRCRIDKIYNKIK